MKLDNEFLASRGIRVTSPQMMRSAFDQKNSEVPIHVRIKTQDGSTSEYEINNDNKPYSSWTNKLKLIPGGSQNAVKEIFASILKHADLLAPPERVGFLEHFASQLTSAVERGKAGDTPEAPILLELKIDGNAFFKVDIQANTINQFLVYSPENSALRIFEREGQIEPLGINGEGLLKLLSVMSKDKNQTAIQCVKRALRYLSWFEDFNIIDEDTRSRMQIKGLESNKRTAYFTRLL